MTRQRAVRAEEVAKARTEREAREKEKAEEKEMAVDARREREEKEKGRAEERVAMKVERYSEHLTRIQEDQRRIGLARESRTARDRDLKVERVAMRENADKKKCAPARE